MVTMNPPLYKEYILIKKLMGKKRISTFSMGVYHPAHQRSEEYKKGEEERTLFLSS
jgi:hypothetical protein